MIVDTVADVLEAAADHIRVQGHHKGGYAPSQTNVYTLLENVPKCAIGAIFFIAGTRRDLALGAWIELSENVGATPVSRWNDRASTTAKEVIDTMLATAKDLRNGKAA